MTMQDWAAIAIAISAPIAAFATLLAPSLAEIVKFRINQPKPSPEANQPKNRIQRTGGGFKFHLKRFGVSYVVLFLTISLLIREISDTAPVTRQSVFTIAFLTASLFAVFLLLALGAFARSISGSLGFIAQAFTEYLIFSGKDFSLTLALFNMIDELGLDIAATFHKRIPKPASRKNAVAILQEIRDLAVTHRINIQE